MKQALLTFYELLLLLLLLLLSLLSLSISISYFSIGQEIILIFNPKIEKIRAVFSFLVIFTREWDNSGVFMTLTNICGGTILEKFHHEYLKWS